MFTLNRSKHNPILSPMREHPWESAAAFNGCPIVVGKKTMMVYRAMSEPELLKEPHIRTSVIGVATSTNGTQFDDRSALIIPDQDFDKFGCEDPRVTKLDDTYYIFYTGLGGYPFGVDNIKIAVALSKDLKTVQEKHPVTPFNAKGMSLFPDRVNGKIAGILTVNTDKKPSDICYVEFDKPEDIWSADKWNEWYSNLDAHKINIRRLPEDHLEFGAPPVRTEQGWLLVYSHIQRYGRPDVTWGIEVVLLDLKNPRLVIGRTKGPFMVPEAYYEHVGQVPHITFPSGSLIRDGHLEIYYGAADTHCAMASIPLDNLLASITETEKKAVTRFPGNPIISPRPGMLWEEMGTINPAAIDLGNKTHILYRAVAPGNISTIGYAVSSDGFSIDERPDKAIYFPRAPFETKVGGGNNFGCEDPRLVLIDDKVYMTYTGYDGITPRVAVSSISTADFLARKWSAWSMPDAITPNNVPNKDSTILPEKVNGKYMIFHRVNESICVDFFSSLDFKKEQVNKCIEIISPRKGMWDGGKVGISTPPIKTPKGWLLLYHGVSWSTTYRVGAVLLDLDDPTVITARTAVPLFEPHAEYEHKGLVPNVVFPCGLVVRKGIAYMYYGGGDSVIGVATIKMSELMRMLEV
jgi:beta-1,2-mannobiose phosphorylase / 1,2-beta-oligomannan phosphorylase